MAIKTKDPSVTTFTPLSGGRLRCNQTGVVVKKGRADAYRAMRAANPRMASREGLEEARQLQQLKKAPPMFHMPPG